MFQDRYKSEPVEDDAYFLTVVRYLYQKPVKAGLVISVEKYTWSKYKEYIEGNEITDTGFTLIMFNTDREKAVKSFIEYINKVNDDVCLEISEKRQVTDEDIRNIIKKLCKVNLREGYSLSVRQIERLTGINRGIIQKLQGDNNPVPLAPVELKDYLDNGKRDQSV